MLMLSEIKHLEKLGFKQNERGANTWVIIPNDTQIMSSIENLSAIPCVTPIQIYLDLKGHPERASDTAKEVLNYMPWRSIGRQNKTAIEK